MKRKAKNQRKVALPLACSVVLGAPAVMVGQALAQATAPAESAETMERVIVTGSNIPTAENVGAAPITVLNAEAIQQTGATDTLQLLRQTTPVFMGNSSYGQEVNNGGAGESYASIRNLPTLVLLNGKRLASSSFSNGTAVDLNTMPVSMIERIEVFKDGASAIYGSDAVGGVINVIMKKDFNGVDITGRYGFTTQEGDGYYQVNASIVGGLAVEKGWITAGAEYYYSTPLLTKDRDFASMGILELADKNLNPPSYVSPTYSGRIDNTVLAGSPYAMGNPNYNPAITTIPSEFLGKKNTVADLVNAGVLIPLSQTPAGQLLNNNGVGGYPLINTTLLDTYSFQEQDRRQFFSDFEYELAGKGLVFYGDFLYSDTVSTAQLAPAPASFLGLSNTTIPADNPYNPFGIALGADGAGSPRIRQRFMDTGNRTFQYESDYYRFVGGFKGDVAVESKGLSDVSWETYFDYNLSSQLGTTFGAPSAANLNLALTPDFDADPTGRISKLNGLPTYNYFTTNPTKDNDPRTVEALKATLFNQGESQLYDWNMTLRGNTFELPAGKIGWAVGGDYRNEQLSLAYDYLSLTGQAIGLNASGNFPGGSRTTWDGYAEVRVPVFSEDMNIPAFTSLTIDAAGRYESVDPGGTSAVPQVGLRWQPVGKQVTLRMTYSESFIAPSLYSVYGPTADNYPTIGLPADPGNAVDKATGQVLFQQQSSKDLKNSTAVNWTGGIVISPDPIKGLTVSVDYYNINNPDIYVYDWQGFADSLNSLGSASPYASRFSFADGSTLTSTAQNQVTIDNWGSATIERSLASQKTDGFDLNLVYSLPTDSAGTFTFGTAANLVLNYEVAGASGVYYEYAGQYTASVFGAQGSIPGFVVIPSVNWQYGGLNVNVSARYVPTMESLGLMFPAVGATEHGGTVNGQAWTIDSYYTIDMQIAYDFSHASDSPWLKGLRAAIGVNNLTDSMVSLVPEAEDNTDKQTYDVIGRLVYFELGKKF